MPPTDSATYEVHRITWKTNRGTTLRFFTTRPATIDRYRREGYDVTPLTARLRVGQEVRVQAYGRLRTGRVLKLNRLRFVVEFVRNAQGDLDTRSFSPADLDPETDYS